MRTWNPKAKMTSVMIVALLSLSGFNLQAQEFHSVEILKFKFIPAEITIKAGESIRWSNKEKRQYHSVWFEKSGEPEPDYFFPGESYKRTFEKPGIYPYRCGPHPKMLGTVTVE